MKKLLLLLIMIMLSSSVLGFHSSTFQDGTSTGNMTFNGINNVTKYLNIPIGVTLTEATLSLKGYAINYSNNYSAFVNNAGDNVTTYSGIWTVLSGSIVNESQANNQDWTDNAIGLNPHSAYYRINFTDPRGYTSVNVTFRAQSSYAVAGSMTLHCYNSTDPSDWISIWSKPGGALLQDNYTYAIPKDCYNRDYKQIEFRFGMGGSDFQRLYDIQIQATHPPYPENVTLLINGSQVYNNASVFDGNDTINLLTGGFLQDYINNTTPIPLTFLSNSSGNLSYYDLDLHYNNTLTILIYDENTGALITDNITVLLSNDSLEVESWTTTGIIYLTGVYDGNYTLKGYGTDYDPRYYFVTFTGGASISTSMYLSKNATSTVTFTLRNQLTYDSIENAFLTMERFVNGSWQEVESKLSDIHGEVALSYIPETRYRFTASIDGFTSKTWILDPILNPAYTVLLLPSGLQGASSDYYGVEFDIQPRIFKNNTWNNISTPISSPGGVLSNYTVVITYPTGTTSQSGNISTGETFSFQFNITGALINDSAMVQFSYTNTLGVTRTYRYPFIITGGEAGTLASQRETNQGLGLFERLLLMIFCSFIVGGAVMAIGGVEAGLGVALLVQGILAYLLAINILFIFPSILAGVLLLSRRTQ